MLNDTRVRNAKGGHRPIKLSDSGGLYLLLTPNGSKLWRLAYRFGGKQKTLALGIYPTITLKQARERRDAAKRLLADKIDPSIQRQIEKQNATTGNTFRPVASELLEKLEREGLAEVTLRTCCCLASAAMAWHRPPAGGRRYWCLELGL
jgi:hypothetical protein